MGFDTVKLVLSDVDGTLVTGDKVLTEATIDAVARLRRAGISFAITSGRPPRGLTMLVDPLAIETPIAALNGAVIVEPDLEVIAQRTIPGATVVSIIDALDASGLGVWIYRGSDWLVRNAAGSHVAKDSATVRFPPTVVSDFSTVTTHPDGIVKVVGVTDDPDLMAAAESALRNTYGEELSVTQSQSYYLEFSHPKANKGVVVEFLANRYTISTANVATIGDMPTDTLMFAKSGMSIAMGNAEPSVQRVADHVTTSNDDDGFAKAIDRFILTHSESEVSTRKVGGP